MRKIAIIAVAFALLTAVANIHMAGAHMAQYSKEKPAHTISRNIKLAAVQQQPAVPAPAAGPVTVTVVPGDTLSGIAATNDTTYMRLFDVNDFINNPNLIHPGDQIRIPASDEQLTDRAVPQPAASQAAPAAAPAPAPAPASAPTEVTVQSGDTLSGIASESDTTYTRMFDANPAISDPNVLYAGEQLRVPSASEQLPSREPAAATPAPAPAPQAAPAPVSHPAVVSSGTPDNAAKAYIYAHESSNNPNATNYLGCYGLGQDCSGKLRPLCGADYDCQDRFFDNYAQARYGGWANAEAFWQAHHWW